MHLRAMCETDSPEPTRYTCWQVYRLFAPLRFLWNATRGARLRPWRSPYLRWRIETYSGKWAEDLSLREIGSFVWAERWELLRFLFWTGSVQREARRRP